MGEARMYDISDKEKLERPINPSVLPVAEERELTEDEKTLVALGYKPELRREFDLWTIFSVSFAVLGLLPSFATTLYYVCGEIPVVSRAFRIGHFADLMNVDQREWDMQELLVWYGDGSSPESSFNASA